MQNIFSTLQVSSCPCAVHPSFHPLPGKTWMFFLSPHISLRFLEFHVNGIIQYVLSSLNWLITYQPLTFPFTLRSSFITALLYFYGGVVKALRPPLQSIAGPGSGPALASSREGHGLQPRALPAFTLCDSMQFQFLFKGNFVHLLETSPVTVKKFTAI